MNKEHKYLQNVENPAPHTGTMLQRYYKQHKISKAALARTLNRQASTIYQFEKRQTIQTAVLWELCHALRHNFFADIAHQLPQTYTTSTAKDDKIAALTHENARLQSECDLLKSILIHK